MEKRWSLTEGDKEPVKLGLDEGGCVSISCGLISWLDYTMMSFCPTCLDLRGFEHLYTIRIRYSAAIHPFSPGFQTDLKTKTVPHHQ
jgi:hypothetical protein